MFLQPFLKVRKFDCPRLDQITTSELPDPVVVNAQVLGDLFLLPDPRRNIPASTLNPFLDICFDRLFWLWHGFLKLAIYPLNVINGECKPLPSNVPVGYARFRNIRITYFVELAGL